MTKAKTNINGVITTVIISRKAELIHRDINSNYHQVITSLGKEWCVGKAGLEIKVLMDTQATADDSVVYAGVSVLRDRGPGCGFSEGESLRQCLCCAKWCVPNKFRYENGH